MNIIIIPAYNPDEHLVSLVKSLRTQTDQPIIVVNDGSSNDYNQIFNQVQTDQCIVLKHQENKGKGAAIKTAIKYAHEIIDPLCGYVTCDADGQHQPLDIMRVFDKLELNPKDLILGERQFDEKNVPLKNRLGNRFSTFYMKQKTHLYIEDTQTGLRGIPNQLTELSLSIDSNRYDYEMDFLMQSIDAGINILKVPIKTTYLQKNESSHFRPIVDSLKIYKQPIRFGINSLISAGIDLTIFTFLVLFLDQSVFLMVLIATVVARIISGIYNFLMNRIWSFQNRSNIKKQSVRYFILYIIQLSLSFLIVYLLSFLFAHLTVVKAFVDVTLFVCSYFVQKHWVFKKTHLVHANT